MPQPAFLFGEHVNKYKRDPLCDDLFEVCDTVLYDLVRDSAAACCRALDDLHEVLPDLIARVRRLPVKTTAYYLAYALKAMYNACQDWEKVTPDGIAIRTRTFIGLFAKFCEENAFHSESAWAASETWE